MEGRRGKAARPWPETKCRDVRELFDPTPSLAGLPIWPAAEGYRLTGTRTVSKYLPASLSAGRFKARVAYPTQERLALS
jgi:hypothetical protein